MKKEPQRNIFLLTLLLFILSSCSHVSLINKNISNQHINTKTQMTSNNDLESVDLNQNEEVINQAEESPRIKSEETVDLLGGKVFVENKEDDNSLRHLNRKIKVGLVFGPGLNRTVGYISVLRNLDKSGSRIDFISGSEMGAVIAAMYASGMTTQVIEWNFYKYFQEKSNAKLFSDKWLKEIDEFFLKRFTNTRVENLKKPFFIPLGSKSQNKVVFFNKGNLRNLLLLNFKMQKDVGNSDYYSSIESEAFSTHFMRSSGAEILVGVDSLGTKVEFAEKNNEYEETYKKLVGYVKRDRKNFDLFLSLPLEKSFMDGDKDVGLNLQESLDFSEKLVRDLQKKKESKVKALNNECESGCL